MTNGEETERKTEMSKTPKDTTGDQLTVKELLTIRKEADQSNTLAVRQDLGLTLSPNI